MLEATAGKRCERANSPKQPADNCKASYWKLPRYTTASLTVKILTKWPIAMIEPARL